MLERVWRKGNPLTLLVGMQTSNGEQCGYFLKNWKQNCHMTQQSHFWAYTPRIPDLKETRAPQCSSQHCLSQPVHGSNLDAHQQTNGQGSCGTYTPWNITQPLKRIHLNQVFLFFTFLGFPKYMYFIFYCFFLFQFIFFEG